MQLAFCLVVIIEMIIVADRGTVERRRDFLVCYQLEMGLTTLWHNLLAISICFFYI